MSNSSAGTAAAVDREEVSGKAEMEFAAAVSASEGTTKCKKKKKKRKQQEAANAEEGVTVDQEAASVAAAVSALEGTPKLKEEEEEKAKEREMVEEEATTAAVSAAEEGTSKCKKKKKKKAKEAAYGEESGMIEQEAAPVAAAAVLAMEKTPKSKKKKKKEMTKEREMVEQEATTAAVSAAEMGSPKCKKKEAKDVANAKESGTVEQEATSVVAAAVLALEGTPKSKKEKAKEREMVEQEATTTDASALEGTPNCKKKEKVKDKGMAEQDANTATVSALEGTPKCKKKEKIKETGMDELETSAAISALEETQKYKNKEQGDETGLAKQETTTEVSALEKSPKPKKLKKKSKMQDQEKSPQALLSPVVDKIVASKHGSVCTNGEGASVDADVSMDPINGEDPNCSEVKDTNEKVKYKAGEENKDCSQSCSSLRESSENRKRRRRKRKRDRSSRGLAISSQDGDRVVKRCMHSSMEHDLNCICASCLVRAHKEKVTNIYSPRGSLIRFQRKKLLILDLNGLLADINMDYQNAHRAHAKVKAKLVFRRPYCDDFLRFCFQNFELGIWSSRNKDNVNSVVNILMRDLKQYLLFCWDMSNCTVTGCNTVENKHKPLVLKELKKLWNKEDPNLPWEQGEFSPSNTLLVDDSPYKALCNPPHTAIFPQPYSYLKERSDYSLGPGGDLRVYLEGIAAADDVQVFVRDNPFGQPSITESDPHWNFYAQIVDKMEKSVA